MRDKRDSQKKRFIDALTARGTVYHAAQAVGVSRWTAYRWRDEDKEFREGWDDALENAADVMETSTYEKALGEPDSQGRYMNGDSLLKMFWLKAHRAKFRDRIAVDVQAIQREVREHLTALMQQRQTLAIGAGNTEFVSTESTNESTPIESMPEASASIAPVTE